MHAYIRTYLDKKSYRFYTKTNDIISFISVSWSGNNASIWDKRTVYLLSVLAYQQDRITSRVQSKSTISSHCSLQQNATCAQVKGFTTKYVSRCRQLYKPTAQGTTVQFNRFKRSRLSVLIGRVLYILFVSVFQGSLAVL